MQQSNRITSIYIALAVVLCISSYISNAQVCGQRRVRKPLNIFTRNEWAAFNRGFLTLKRNGQLNGLIRRHRDGMMYHGTPFFLPMHRALMVEFENALLRVEPSLTGCPYWDELREASGLGRSDVFTHDRLSPIAPGPLTGAYRGLTDDYDHIVTRDPSRVPSAFTWLPHDEVITKIMMGLTNFGDFSRIIEMSPHNQFHMLIGGQMGRTSLSPCDPAFWVHHCYIDMLWALWQSLRRQNNHDLTVFNGRGPQPNEGVVLFSNRWTNRDMTMYRERLCYQYNMPSTRATRLKRRWSVDREPEVSPQSDSGQISPSAAGVKSSPSKCHATANPKPYFKPMWRISDDRIKTFMSNCTIQKWRDTESEINKVIEELNFGISSGEINPDELPNIRSLFEKSEMNCTSSSEPDNYKDSLIPEVQQLAQNNHNANLPGNKACNLHRLPSILSYFAVSMAAFFLCF